MLLLVGGMHAPAARGWGKVASELRERVMTGALLLRVGFCCACAGWWHDAGGGGSQEKLVTLDDAGSALLAVAVLRLCCRGIRAAGQACR